MFGSGLVKNLTFSYKRVDFTVIVNISVKTLWCHAIDTIFAFFIVSISFNSWWFLFFLFDMISVLQFLKIQTFSNLPIFNSKQNIIIL